MSAYIRVSIGVLCRIEQSGKFLLGVNKNRQSAGLEVLTPIGGAIEITSAQERLELDALGAQWERPQQWTETGSLDLRFRLPTKNIPALERWLTGFDRAGENALRELYEELGNEYVAVSLEILDREIATMPAPLFLGRHVMEASTERIGQEGVLTRRYSLVCDIAASGVLCSILEDFAAKPNSLLVWATADEIRVGMASLGPRIGANALSLLDFGEEEDRA